MPLFVNRLFSYTILLLFTCSIANGQFGISAGAVTGYPFYLGKQGYYNSSCGGATVGLSYNLPDNRIYPSLEFNVSGAQLPLFVYSHFNDIYGIVTYKHASLDLNYKLSDNDKHFELKCGIGVASIKYDHGLATNQSQIDLRLYDRGGSNVFPTVNLGLKYVKPLNWNGLYLTAELNLRYIYVFENNNYYIMANKTLHMEASAAGRILYPAAMVGVKYIFQKPKF